MDYDSLEKAFCLSPSPSKVLSYEGDQAKPAKIENSPATPNSSVSLSSCEAGGDEDKKDQNQPKDSENLDGEECSRKV